MSQLSDDDARLSGYYKVVHKPKETRTGILVLLGLLAWGFTFVWIRTGGFRSPATVRAVVTLDDVRGLTVGDPVMIAGARVGKVERVDLVEAGEVRIILQLQVAVRPHRDARAAVRPLDFLGSRYVDYRPGVAAEVLEDGAAIVGIVRQPWQASAEVIRSQSAEVAFLVQDMVTDEFREALRATGDAVAGAHAALAGTDVAPLRAAAAAALESAERASERLASLVGDTAWASSANDVAAARAEAAHVSEELARATDALGRMLARADSGHGTVGRLQTDSVLAANVEAMRRILRGFAR